MKVGVGVLAALALLVATAPAAQANDVLNVCVSTTCTPVELQPGTVQKVDDLVASVCKAAGIPAGLSLGAFGDVCSLSLGPVAGRNIVSAGLGVGVGAGIQHAPGQDSVEVGVGLPR